MKRCDEQKQLIREIQKHAFMAVDIQLFMDTHPNCEQSQEALARAVACQNELTETYEKQYGALTIGGMDTECEYSWTDEPWPWEREA